MIRKSGDAMYYTEILVIVIQNSCSHVSHSFLNLLFYTFRDDVVNGILETLQGLLNGMHLQKNMERNFRYFRSELT